MVKQSSVTTKMPPVFRGKKCVIHGCLSKKASSSARSAASSNTIKRYESETTITIRARNRQPQKTDVMPNADTKEKITIRTMSLLVSLLTTECRLPYNAFRLRTKRELQSRTKLNH